MQFVGEGITYVADKIADPLFAADRANGNYHLRAGSPAIDSDDRRAGIPRPLDGVVALLPPGRWRLLVLLVGGIFVVADGAAVVTDGGHWPSDVIAGWCIAFVWVAALRIFSGDPLKPAADALLLPTLRKALSFGARGLRSG